MRGEAGKAAPRPLRTLTTTREAHSLSSAEAARGYPIHLRVVVTYFDPKVGETRTGLFVYDSTGSIFVDLPRGIFNSLPAGSLIDLRGVSSPGEFAPIVSKPQIKIIGFAGLPPNPHRPTYARLLSGAEDGQWVEVEGVVHSILEDARHVNLQLAMADGTISVMLEKEPGATYSRLVDAKVRIRGNAGPLFDSTRTQMIGARIQCPNLSAMTFVEAAPDDPFKLPVIPIHRILQWDVAPLLPHRVHVQGRVTLDWPGKSLCIRDAAQGICARTEQSTLLRDGEVVDIAGFARAKGPSPTLTDAIFRRVGSTVPMPAFAEAVSADEIMAGGHASQLIQIDGQLISRDLAAADTTLLLNSGKFIFTAILPKELSGPESDGWKNGSVLRLRGVTSVEIDTERTGEEVGTVVPKSFRIMIDSPGDVLVLQRPSWWTPAHMVFLLALALAGTLVVLAWVMILRRRIRESEERFRHLALHDGLTGLATRLLLDDRLIAAMGRADRDRTDLALLMLDLDKFKQINDTYGHQAGDEVLRVTSQRLLYAVRQSDTVARLGGDEFVVLLADLKDRKIAEKIAANIVKALAAPVMFEGQEIPVSGSVGVCVASAGEPDLDLIMKKADAALYCAKKQGRSCYVIHSAEITDAVPAD